MNPNNSSQFIILTATSVATLRDALASFPADATLSPSVDMDANEPGWSILVESPGDGVIVGRIDVDYDPE